MGLVRSFAGAGGSGQRCLRELMGRVRISVGVDGIRSTFSLSAEKVGIGRE